MKIDCSKIGKFCPFEVLPTEGRTIFAQFVDAETGLLIVREVENVLIKGNHSKPTFVTTIDLNRATIVPIEQRKQYIDYSYKIENDDTLKVQSLRERIIDKATGSESFVYKVYNAINDEVIISGTSVAFSDTEAPSGIEKYRKLLEEERREKAFWKDTYPKKSYTEKLQYWGSGLHRRMRWNGESGLDEYAVFSKRWLTETKKVEPQIKQILKDLATKYWWNAYGWEWEKIEAALRQ